MKIKKVKLLKDTPEREKGTVYEWDEVHGEYCHWCEDTDTRSDYQSRIVENNSDWFEEIKEKKLKSVWQIIAPILAKRFDLTTELSVEVSNDIVKAILDGHWRFRDTEKIKGSEEKTAEEIIAASIKKSQAFVPSLSSNLNDFCQIETDIIAKSLKEEGFIIVKELEWKELLELKKSMETIKDPKNAVMCADCKGNHQDSLGNRIDCPAEPTEEEIEELAESIVIHILRTSVIDYKTRAFSCSTYPPYKRVKACAKYILKNFDRKPDADKT